MLLKKLDFLSPNITLYYYNKKRHSSVIGGLLSLIMIILCIIIFLHYSLIKVYPSDSSLLIYRNYNKEINMYFDKNGLFHYIWIFNDNIINNKASQNIMQLNNLKKGVIRIYMTSSYDKYEYNSSYLKDNDHWVYDTCADYVDENDLKYDFSFSSCIRYYYNSIDKKYYSINDSTNFKYPYSQVNKSIFENNFYGTFIEKCTNNSILNEILGDCFPEEKINEYLSNFNNVFLSFINNRFGDNDDNPVQYYSHKIYDIINNQKTLSYIHELTFIPFSYKVSKGILSKKLEYNSFIFDEDKTSKIYHKSNNKLLIAYIFNSKLYINEFRKANNDILEFINGIGGCIFLIYSIFFIINYIISQRIELRNFQWFLNSKNNSLIHRHTNYEKNEFFSIKTDLSNDLIEKRNVTNTFKSTYFGNMFRSNITNFNNYTNDDINPKINNSNNYTIRINKIESDGKEKGKNGDNIIVINNNSFMNDNINNNYISNDSIEKHNYSLNIDNKKNKFEDLKKYHKTFTYNKSSNESQSVSKLKDVLKNNNLNDKKIKIIESVQSNSKRKDSADFNSKQKIIDTSSISLLNSTNNNKLQNLYINPYNYDDKKEKRFIPLSTIKNPLDLNYISNYKSRIHISEKNLPKDTTSLSHKNDFINHSPIKKNEKLNIITNITFENKERRKSYMHRTNINREKDDKNKKEKTKRFGVFLKLPDKKSERHLSLFSKHSNCIYPSEKTFENKSQKIDKSFIEQNKRTNIIKKKIKKNQSTEVDSRNQKNYQNDKFAKIIQNYQLYPKNVWDYICLCKKTGNSVYILNNFRQKLLSEEYLYILHINMFIFKQKYGCKSNFEHSLLLEELYNDY